VASFTKRSQSGLEKTGRRSSSSTPAMTIAAVAFTDIVRVVRHAAPRAGGVFASLTPGAVTLPRKPREQLSLCWPSGRSQMPQRSVIVGRRVGDRRRVGAASVVPDITMPIGTEPLTEVQLATVLAGARVAQMIAGHDFFWFEHGDHVHTRSADAHREKPGPVVCV